MNVISKGNVEFLVINTFGDGKFLNPYYININHIRYIREYNEFKDIKDNKENKDSKDKSWAIFVGNKMISTNDDIGLNKCGYGDVVKIGTKEFECCMGGSLTDKIPCMYFINYNNVFYIRKYIDNDKIDKIDKNLTTNVQSVKENDKFAIITIDERIIPAKIKMPISVTNDKSN